MAKRPAKPADDTEVRGLELDEIYTGATLSPALESLYSELDIEPQMGQVQVFISKIDAATGKEARIWQGTPIDYDLHALAKRFGSAEYRVKVFVPNETGRVAQRGNKVFKMELDPADDARIEMMRKGITQPAPAPSITPEGIAALVAQAVKQAMPVPVAPAANPLDIIKGLADVFKNMMPTAQPGMNALDALKTAASIIREMRGDDGDREPLARGVNASGMDVFMKLIDKFGPTLLAVAQSGQPGQPAQPAALSAPVHVAGAGNGEAAIVEDDAVLKFKMGLAFLVSQAMADNDPSTYAAMILDNVPEADIDKFLANDAWLDYLAGFEPRVKNFDKWFTELREAVIALRADTLAEGAGATPDALTDGAEPGKTH
jgi:hypothetical protein